MHTRACMAGDVTAPESVQVGQQPAATPYKYILVMGSEEDSTSACTRDVALYIGLTGLTDVATIRAPK